MIVKLGSDWRRWQAEQWPHIRRARISVLVVHRRAGKTVMACMWLLGRCLERPGCTGAYIGPQQKQVRAHVWPLLRKRAMQIPGASCNETEMRVDLPGGSRILCLGSENADAIRGAGLTGGAVVDEVAQIGPTAWGQVIYPALNDPGVDSQALLIGTPQGQQNLFYEMYEKAGSTPDWYRAYLPVGTTGVYSELEVARLKAEMSKEDFAQEYDCDWSAAVRGAYFGAEMAEADRQGRIRAVPHDPALKVHTSIDLGIRHAFVVWLWQVVAAEVRAIGVRAFTGSSIPQIWSELQETRYNWGEHYAPHDSQVRELGTGKSRIEIARQVGWNWRETPQVGLKAGIETTRLMIPRVYFDRDNCKHGIEALRLYRPDHDDVAGTYSLQPMDSWANDYADAFRMFAVGSQGRMPDKRPLDYRHMDRAMV